MHEDGWTDGRVELLKKLWAEGLSASQMATALGGGLTRNAVIGKIHRLKFPSLPRPAARIAPRRAPPHLAAKRITGQGRQNPQRNRRLQEGGPGGTTRRERVDAALDELGAPDLEVKVSVGAKAYDETALMLPLEQLSERTCKWPIGDPRDPFFGFCGHPSIDGKPYCDHHGRRAFVRL